MSSEFSVKLDPSRLMPAAAPQQKTEIDKMTMNGHTFSVSEGSGSAVAALGQGTISKTQHEVQVSQKFQSGPQDKAIGGAVTTQTASSFLINKAPVHPLAKTEVVSITELSSSQKMDFAGRALGHLERQHAKLTDYLSRTDISPENRLKAQEKLNTMNKIAGEIKSRFPGVKSNPEGIRLLGGHS